MKIQDVDVGNIFISKLIETWKNSKYLIGYLDDVITPLVLRLPKMNGYVKNFADQNNKLMSFRIDDGKLLEKQKIISSKVEDLKDIEFYAFPVYNDRCMKTKIGTYGVKVYTIAHGLNMPEDSVEYKSFAVICIGSLLFYENKYYLQIYLDDRAYKIIDTQMIDYLDDNLFESDRN